MPSCTLGSSSIWSKAFKRDMKSILSFIDKDGNILEEELETPPTLFIF